VFLGGQSKVFEHVYYTILLGEDNDCRREIKLSNNINLLKCVWEFKMRISVVGTRHNIDLRPKRCHVTNINRKRAKSGDFNCFRSVMCAVRTPPNSWMIHIGLIALI